MKKPLPTTPSGFKGLDLPLSFKQKQLMRNLSKKASLEVETYKRRVSKYRYKRGRPVPLDEQQDTLSRLVKTRVAVFVGFLAVVIISPLVFGSMLSLVLPVELSLMVVVHATLRSRAKKINDRFELSSEDANYIRKIAKANISTKNMVAYMDRNDIVYTRRDMVDVMALINAIDVQEEWGSVLYMQR